MSKDKKAEMAKVAQEAKAAAEVAVLETREEAAKAADAVKTAEAEVRADVKKDVKAVGEKVKKEAKAAEAKARKAVKAAGDKVKKDAKAVETKAKKAVKAAEDKAAEDKAAKVTTFVQFAGLECSVADVEARALEAFKAEHKRTAVKSMTVYVKPEDRAAYYVVNDEFTGKVEL